MIVSVDNGGYYNGVQRGACLVPRTGATQGILHLHYDNAAVPCMYAG